MVHLPPTPDPDTDNEYPVDCIVCNHPFDSHLEVPGTDELVCAETMTIPWADNTHVTTWVCACLKYTDTPTAGMN